MTLRSPVSKALDIHPVDHVLVAALDHPALHLQGRGHLAVGDREFLRENGEALDLLVARELSVELVDVLPDLSNDLGSFDHATREDAVAFTLELVELRLGKRDERREVLPAVAHD